MNRFVEFFGLLKCLSWRRLTNLIKVKCSQWLSHLFGFPILWGVPWAISVEPTSFCNLKCVECPTGNGSILREQGSMQLDMFKSMIDSIYKNTFYLNLYLQGEPMLHPHFGEMITYAKSKKMYVFTSTNGHFITENTSKQLINSRLDKLIISLDGHNQHSYQQYRVGGSLEQVLKGIKSIFRFKKEFKAKIPLVVAQILLLKTTENYLNEIKEMAFEAGADRVEYKKAQFYNPNLEGNLLPENPNYLRYQYTDYQGWVSKKKRKRGCKRLWDTIVVTWDGKVLPCCYDKDALHNFGNCRSKPLTTILYEPNAKIFRKNVFKKKSYYPMCENCGE